MTKTTSGGPTAPASPATPSTVAAVPVPRQRRSERGETADRSSGRSPARLRRLEPWRDAVLLGLATHAVLVVIALVDPGPVGLVLLAVPLGIVFATGTLTVLHDAGHRMFAARAWPNVLAVQLTVPAGLWVGHWTLKHRAHHKLIQVYELDEATRSSPLLRLHPEAPLLPVHRYQHLYAWGLYSLAWAGELKSQLTFLTTGRVAGSEAPGTLARLGSFAVEKTLWVLVLLPYARALGLLHLALLLLVAETLASLVAAVSTVIGHVSLGLEPEAGLPGKRWTRQVVATTASFGTGSVLLRFWTGGLTHHLAHHLRPVALRSELPALHDTTVRDVAASVGLPVAEYPTFRAAVVAHYRRMHELGTPAGA